MASNRYFGRAYHLRFDVNGTSLDLDSTATKTPCDIKFDVSYAQGQTAREGTISILGFHSQNINTFLNLAGMTRGDAMSKMVHCRLDAGYESEAGMINIFDGFVWYASVTSPPQKWVNLKVAEYNPMGSKGITIKYMDEVDLLPFIEKNLKDFSKSEGVEIVVEDRTEKSILGKEKSKKFTIADICTLEMFVKELNNQASDKIGFILLTEGASKGNQRTLIAIDKDNTAASKAVIPVDNEHGLLSVSGIDALQGSITTFIDKQSANTGLCHLHLTSELNPQANGTYLIVRKQHIGHYQGQEWYTKYTCKDKKV